MRLRILTLAALAALPLFAAGEAQAGRGDYCREFTKSIRVGGNLETGYGKACLMPDGSWQIVASSGTLKPHEVFPSDIRRRIVYYEPRPYYYAPVRYYAPAPRYHDRGYHRGHHKKEWHRHDRRGGKGHRKHH